MLRLVFIVLIYCPIDVYIGSWVDFKRGTYTVQYQHSHYIITKSYIIGGLFLQAEEEKNVGEKSNNENMYFTHHNIKVTLYCVYD